MKLPEKKEFRQFVCDVNNNRGGKLISTFQNQHNTFQQAQER